MMTSSADDLLDLLSNQFEVTQEQQKEKKNRKSSHNSGNSEWSYDKVANMLNIELDDADQIEGNLLYTLHGAKRFFAFDNHTIEQLPYMIKKAAGALEKGESFNYTKMYNQYVVKVGFPTEMGLPFVYSVQVPTLISVGGEARLQSHPQLGGHGDKITVPQYLNLTTDVKITYASKVQSKLGFIAPFSHQGYIAGYDTNTQVHLPLRAKVDVDLANRKLVAKVQPLYPHQDHKLAEYSGLAYTTRHDILDLTPPQTDDIMHVVHVRPVNRFETTVGQQETGFAVDFKVETEQKYFDWAYFYNGLQRHDPMSAFLYFDKQHTIQPYTNYTLTYNPHKTTANTVKFTINYDDEQEYGNHGSDDRQNGAIPSTVTPDSEKRQKEFFKKAAAGVQDSYTQVVDMAAEFEGETKAQYVATAAYSRSPVSPKSRLLLFLSKDPAQKKPYQVALEVDTKMPVVPLEQYKKALNTDPTSTFVAQLNFGEKGEYNSEIRIKGKLEQTEENKRYVKEHPLSQLCEKEMEEGNYILPACRNASVRANFLDHYNFLIDYQKVPMELKNATYKVYAVARHLLYPYVSENIVNTTNGQGKVELDINFAADLKSVNVSIDAPGISSEMTNLRVNPWVRPLVVVHPEYSAVERFSQKLFLSQQYPTCVVDKNFATTFDNRTYPIHIGKCWHVMLHSTPQPHYDGSVSTDYEHDHVSVLVRDVEDYKREVMLVLGDYVVSLVPSSSGTPADYFLVNGERVRVTRDAMAHYEDKRGDTIVEVYRLPTGAYRLYTPEHGFEVVYDGLRVKFQAPNGYRGDVRGLCGTFDGEKATDFTSPKNCVLKDPLEFAASYAVADGSCQGPAREYRQRAQKAECYRRVVTLGDVVSEREAGRRPTGQKVQKSNYQKTGTTTYRTKVLEQNGKICFSLKPQATCAAGYQPSRRVEQMVDFVCVQESKVARHWVDMISKGANPDFSKKTSNFRATIKLPQSCVPQ